MKFVSFLTLALLSGFAYSETKFVPAIPSDTVSNIVRKAVTESKSYTDSRYLSATAYTDEKIAEESNAMKARLNAVRAELVTYVDSNDVRVANAAAEDATAKANAAQMAAEAAASVDALIKAEAARTNAIDIASQDAAEKTNAVLEVAKSYTDSSITVITNSSSQISNEVARIDERVTTLESETLKNDATSLTNSSAFKVTSRYVDSQWKSYPLLDLTDLELSVHDHSILIADANSSQDLVVGLKNSDALEGAHTWRLYIKSSVAITSTSLSSRILYVGEDTEENPQHAIPLVNESNTMHVFEVNLIKLSSGSYWTWKRLYSFKL